jgi:GNAT superfamily N-acetyltransferase
MMEFKDLDMSNWWEFKEMILQSEQFHPKPIMTEGEEYIMILTAGNIVAKVALADSRYIGNAIGFCLSPQDTKEYGLGSIPENSKTIYLLNFVIDVPYQGRGYGYQLMQDFIKTAKMKGYENLVGHFRPNGSLHLIKKFGGCEKGMVKNWENTGEDYVLCHLDIRSVSIPDSAQEALLQKEALTHANHETGIIQSLQSPLPYNLQPEAEHPLEKIQIPIPVVSH